MTGDWCGDREGVAGGCEIATVADGTAGPVGQSGQEVVRAVGVSGDRTNRDAFSDAGGIVGGGLCEVHRRGLARKRCGSIGDP